MHYRNRRHYRIYPKPVLLLGKYFLADAKKIPVVIKVSSGGLEIKFLKTFSNSQRAVFIFHTVEQLYKANKRIFLYDIVL